MSYLHLKPDEKSNLSKVLVNPYLSAKKTPCKERKLCPMEKKAGSEVSNYIRIKVKLCPGGEEKRISCVQLKTG